MSRLRDRGPWPLIQALFVICREEQGLRLRYPCFGYPKSFSASFSPHHSPQPERSFPSDTLNGLLFVCLVGWFGREMLVVLTPTFSENSGVL